MHSNYFHSFTSREARLVFQDGGRSVDRPNPVPSAPETKRIMPDKNAEKPSEMVRMLLERFLMDQLDKFLQDKKLDTPKKIDAAIDKFFKGGKMKLDDFLKKNKYIAVSDATRKALDTWLETWKAEAKAKVRALEEVRKTMKKERKPNTIMH